MSTLSEKLEDMQPMPGIEAPQGQPSLPTLKVIDGGKIDFSAFAGAETPLERLERALTEVVHGGGVDGETRWDRFTTVGIHRFQCALEGKYSIAVAIEGLRGWMAEQMKPEWNEGVFRSEVRGILKWAVQKGWVFPVEAEAEHAPYGRLCPAWLGQHRGFRSSIPCPKRQVRRVQKQPSRPSFWTTGGRSTGRSRHHLGSFW